MPLSPELQQRVADLRLGITSAPAKVVANEREHLLDLFKAYDAQVSEVARLTAEVATLKAEIDDTEISVAPSVQ